MDNGLVLICIVDVSMQVYIKEYKINYRYKEVFLRNILKCLKIFMFEMIQFELKNDLFDILFYDNISLFYY